jgi:hypothetical protein
MDTPRTRHRRPSSAPLLRAAVLVLLVLLGGALPGAPGGGAACAATVAGLYEGTVPGEATDAGRAAAAEAALRQVAVRVTGRRTAANDPALAAMYGDATQYVQTFRPAAGGQVTVGFDPDSVDAALARAGQPLWSRERPATLVVLVAERAGQPPVLVGGVDGDEKRAVDRAARDRGLPIAWPGALDPTASKARIDDVLAARGDALLDLAQRYEASAVLWGRATPAGVQWHWATPGGGAGGVTGGVADGVNALADRYAQEFASGQSGALALLPITVTGVAKLADYAAAQGALEAIPTVRGVQLESAAADRVTFRVNFRGDLEALKRAVAAGGRLVPRDAEGGGLRFALQP